MMMIHVCTAAVECVYDMVICPHTNVCVFADSFCDGQNDCGDDADEDPDICGMSIVARTHFCKKCEF